MPGVAGVEPDFGREAEWVSSALLAARLEHTALRHLLLKKKLIQSEEYLAELDELASDEFVHSVRRFVAQSETQLRNARWHVGGAEATEQLGRRLALVPRDVVLDIGCGVGGPARQIAETFGCTVAGVDHRLERIIEAMLRTSALGLNSRVSFHVAEGEHLPFEDEVFDAVISQATLDRIPNKTAAVRETYRVLKSEGRFGFECESLTEKGGDQTEQDSSRPFRILAWQQVLAALGFIDIEVEEMWEESRRFYPTGPERDQIDRGERVNVRITARKP